MYFGSAAIPGTGEGPVSGCPIASSGHHLGHRLRVSQGTHLAVISGEGADIFVRAIIASDPRKAVANVAALQAFAKHLFHASRNVARQRVRDDLT